MIELNRHIEILLLTNDCVIVPGLGGFTANHMPARYDNEDNLYIPPSRTLGFNSKLNINDSLLVQSYSEAYDISFPEAFNRLEEETTELKQHIYNEGSYELSDIGTLYLNSDGNIEFIPCEAGLLTPYLYSLSSFEINKISSEQEKEQSDVNNLKSIYTLPTKRKQSQTEERKDRNEENEIEKKTPKRKYHLLRNAAAVILLIISFLIFSEPINDKSGMTRMSNFDTGIVHNLISNGYKNITNKKEIKLKSVNGNNDVKKACTELAKDRIARQETDDKSPFFCIVLASKVSQKNANDFVRKLIICGYDKAEVLTEKGKSIKVVYGHYKTKNEAYNALNSLKGNEHFYDAWIYKVS